MVIQKVPKKKNMGLKFSYTATTWTRNRTEVALLATMLTIMVMIQNA